MGLFILRFSVGNISDGWLAERMDGWMEREREKNNECAGALKDSTGYMGLEVSMCITLILGKS